MIRVHFVKKENHNFTTIIIIGGKDEIFHTVRTVMFNSYQILIGGR